MFPHTIDQIKNNQLSSLNMQVFSIQECINIFELLKANTSIKTLFFSYDNNIYEDEYCRLLGEFLLDNNTIDTLHIFVFGQNYILCKIKWKHIMNALKTNKTVKILIVQTALIGTSSCMRLSNLLKVNTTIDQIYLCANVINIKGREHIMNALQHNSTIVLFDSNHDTDLSVDRRIFEFCQRNKHNSKLKQMMLTDF
jgi:hypothetical protein